MYSGTLICIEGIDGSGKSTLAKQLANSLQHNEYPILLTKEPGGSALGKQLRMLLQTQPVPITPVAEYLLFAADRAQHINDVVLPALKEGKIVISDRMADSSLVYQGYGRGIDKNMIHSVNQWVLQGIEPNLTIYVKIDPAIAKERVAMRTTLTAFEKEQQDFVSRLVRGFDELYAHKHNVIIIDGNRSIDDVYLATSQAVTSWLKEQ